MIYDYVNIIYDFGLRMFVTSTDCFTFRVNIYKRVQITIYTAYKDHYIFI